MNHNGPKGRPWAVALLLLALPVLAAGCGGGLSEVQGHVKTFKGEPVKGGTLVFTPAASGTSAKPATAQVQADGSYKLATGRSVGAAEGTYKVAYTPPQVEMTEAQRTDPKYTPPPPPYLGLAPKADQVEVKAGSNTIDVELVPKGR